MTDKREIKIDYDYDKGETSVKITRGFKSLPETHQIDSIDEAIVELALYHNKLTAKLYGPRYNNQITSNRIDEAVKAFDEADTVNEGIKESVNVFNKANG